MELTREALAEQLEEQLRSGVRGRNLARWAHQKYLDHSPMAPGVYNAVMTLVAIDEGDEFALSDADLEEILDELRAE